MSPGPTSANFTIASTPYGGRGVFASQHIPKDTLILSCKAPYASVICRKFKKEVCAWCFSWSWEVARKSSWKVTVPLEPQLVAEGRKAQRRTGIGGPNAGVWFCREECRDFWVADGEDISGYGISHAGVRGVINMVLEQCLATMEKDRIKPRISPTFNGFELGWIAFLQTLEDIAAGSEISANFIEDTWERAERLSSFSSSSPPLEKAISSLMIKNKPKLAHVSPTSMSEVEIDTARFVLAGLLRKCIEESSLIADRCSGGPLTGKWTDVLDLQDNTLLHLQLKPYILASQIRVWTFVKFVVHLASREIKGLSEQTKHLVQALARTVNASGDTRSILGREHGNVFGIWDMAPEGVDSEMLGWGLFSFGSYFNHNCSPNLRRKAKGRAIEYYTLRDIEEGEEMCISYVEDGDEVSKRHESLKEWFFQCTCTKCETELRVL